jgi:hypothetical protein
MIVQILVFNVTQKNIMMMMCANAPNSKCYKIIPSGWILMVQVLLSITSIPRVAVKRRLPYKIGW